MKKSNKWKYRISIKSFFSDSKEGAVIANIAKKVIDQLKRLIPRIDASNIDKEDINYYLGELEDIVESFQTIHDLGSGRINIIHWDDYGFDGDFVQLFNDALSLLYDLADSRATIRPKIGEPYTEKFIWID